MDFPALDRRRVTVGVVLVAVVGLAVRLVGLGYRVFHWDEARVGYWVLQYAETGIWSYRAVVHGPFLFHVNEFLFGIFGSTDFVARLVVALVSAALPLAALLYRDRLRPVETLALAGFLAFNPVLLYYGRFMRNDVLVGAFAFIALGLFVRLLDTGRRRYLYAGVGILAVGFTTKEIILVYLGVWLGAAVLLLDHRLLTARHRNDGWRAIIGEYGSAIAGRGRDWAIPLYIALLEFLAIIVFFYAPRPDLYQAVTNPGLFPGVAEAATVGAWQELWGMWIAGGHEHSYVDFLLADVERLVGAALPLSLFAIGGFVIDRYSDRAPRDIVSFTFYWGAAIFVIYPAITDISAPWALVHTVIPMAIPAAVGVRMLVDVGGRAIDSGDRVNVALVAVVLLAATAQVGVTAYDTSYANPQDDSNPLVQFGQPAGELQGTLADIEAIAANNDETDVLFYGDHFYVPDESNPLGGGHWTNRFPLTWYLERSDATIDSTTHAERIDGDAPVVIALAEDYSTVNDRLEGYEALTFEITSTNTETVFFIDRSALDSVA